MKTCCSPNPTLSLQFHCPVLRLCPQMFGSPSARPREYRLTWSKDYTWIMDPWTISINSGQFSFMNGFDFQQFQHWFLRMRWTWRFWLRTFSPTQRPIPTWQLIALPWSHMKKSQSHWGENLCFPGTWSQSEFNILCWIVFNSTVNTFVFFFNCVHVLSALLLRSMAWSLKTYRTVYPGKAVFDLSQSAKSGRGRTELQHGELPTLATSSTHLWFPSYNYGYRICGFK